VKHKKHCKPMGTDRKGEKIVGRKLLWGGPDSEDIPTKERSTKTVEGNKRHRRFTPVPDIKRRKKNGSREKGMGQRKVKIQQHEEQLKTEGETE